MTQEKLYSIRADLDETKRLREERIQRAGREDRLAALLGEKLIELDDAKRELERLRDRLMELIECPDAVMFATDFARDLLTGMGDERAESLSLRRSNGTYMGGWTEAVLREKAIALLRAHANAMLDAARRGC